MADRIRVALLDNHPLFRRGIHDALDGTKLSIVAEGEATEDAWPKQPSRKSRRLS